MDNEQSNINKARPPWIQIVSLAAPTLKDNTADADRVLNALKSRLNSEAIQTPGKQLPWRCYPGANFRRLPRRNRSHPQPHHLSGTERQTGIHEPLQRRKIPAPHGPQKVSVGEAIKNFRIIYQIIGNVVMIEHNLREVLRVGQRLAVLDNGLKIADGAPLDVMQNPAVRTAYVGKERPNVAA
jgi:hypothetical protein